ncbi:MAG: hypothetical protein HOQ05_12920 [Corynebacteriales bacterium]|nr:hypothetical protein [Mycobacteriales bacterium]
MPNTTQSGDDWPRLAHYVVIRRRELGLSQAEAARIAQFGARNTWINMETGTTKPRDSKWAGIERALLWARGSVQAILSGAEPTLADSIGAEDEEVEDPARIIRDTVNRSDWDEGTKRALIAIVEDAEARLAEIRKSSSDVHSFRPIA